MVVMAMSVLSTAQPIKQLSVASKQDSASVHCAVNECYTCTLTEGIELDEQHHLKEHSWHANNTP